MALTKDALIVLLATDTSLAGYLEADEIDECADDAAAETGWAFPVSGLLPELWIKRRTKRHCFERLWTKSARKFKVDQLSLNHRFDHYGKVIAKMDADFAEFVEKNPELFSGVDIYKMFGTLCGTGLVYDIAGNDVTNEVLP